MQPLVTKNGKSWLNSKSLLMSEILLHPQKISTIPLSWKIWLESWQTLAQNPISTILTGKTLTGIIPTAPIFWFLEKRIPRGRLIMEL